MGWLKPPASWALLLCKMETFSGWRRVPHRAWRFSGSFLSRDRDFLGWWIRNKWTPFFKATKSWPPTAGIQKKITYGQASSALRGSAPRPGAWGAKGTALCVCVWDTEKFHLIALITPISEQKYHENGRKNASEDVFSYWNIWRFPACHVSWLEGITNPLLAFLSFARCCWPWSICRPMGRFFFVSTRRRPWVTSVRRSWKCWTYHAVRLDHPEVGVRDPLKWWKPL